MRFALCFKDVNDLQKSSVVDDLNITDARASGVMWICASRVKSRKVLCSVLEYAIGSSRDAKSGDTLYCGSFWVAAASDWCAKSRYRMDSLPGIRLVGRVCTNNDTFFFLLVYPPTARSIVCNGATTAAAVAAVVYRIERDGAIPIQLAVVGGTFL